MLSSRTVKVFTIAAPGVARREAMRLTYSAVVGLWMAVVCRGPVVWVGYMGVELSRVEVCPVLLLNQRS